MGIAAWRWVTLAVVLVVASASGLRAEIMVDEDIGPLSIQETEAGIILADDSGMTVYTFDRDPPNKATCAGACAQTWQPFLADEKATAGYGKLDFMRREDGKRQWTYSDKPLYRYVGDQKRGDAKGAKVEGWSTVTVSYMIH